MDVFWSYFGLDIMNIELDDMFTKDERSTFKYWFAHWCAFQMTALNYKVWKINYLFHDVEKPFLRIFFPYKKVQKWHRKYNNHHLEYHKGLDKIDIVAMLIDWECSHLTKQACPWNAQETLELEKNNAIGNDELYNFLSNVVCKYLNIFEK